MRDDGLDATRAPDGTSAIGASVFEAARPSTLGLAMVLIQDAMRMGQGELALELIRASRTRWGDDPGLALVETMLEAKAGRLDHAHHCLESARNVEPQALVTQVYSASLAVESRDLDAARRQLRAVIQRCPDYPGVAGMLSSLLMPGPNYREVLRSIHQIVQPRGYLEIGVETGVTLALASAERIVGIDPDFSPLRRERLPERVQLYEMTSRQFFLRHERTEVLANVPLDLVFIDGMHRFESALEDFYAVERWAHARSIVVMHDALPIAPIYAEPERCTRFWVGDVWKAVYALLRHRLDLDIHVIPTVPSGLVVIRWREPKPESAPLDYETVMQNIELPVLRSDDPVWPHEFPLVTNDLDGYRRALVGTDFVAVSGGAPLESQRR